MRAQNTNITMGQVSDKMLRMEVEKRLSEMQGEIERKNEASKAKATTFNIRRQRQRRSNALKINKHDTKVCI